MVGTTLTYGGCKLTREFAGDRRHADAIEAAMAAAGQIRATILAWTARRARRRAALALDPRTLRDIGIDRNMLVLEAAKPFWRP
jgi:uncharacterized protein YjiS (DUF1127 family)